MMDADSPPPTQHILRPHHIDVLTIVFLMFREMATRKLPADFSLYVYRLLFNEMSEIARPKSHQQMIQLLEKSPRIDDVVDIQEVVASFKAVHLTLSSTEQLTLFFQNLCLLFTPPEPEDATGREEPPILMRHTLFSFYCRRCHLSFLKLSFSGLAKLQNNFQAWCQGDTTAGYIPTQKDQLGSIDTLLFHTRADKKAYATVDAFERWEKAQATADVKVAGENLRRFFEQHFHEGNDSGVRQHALLNLVRMHYLQEEYDAARSLLTEAINVARTSGDRLVLQHCISMLHRLPPANGSKPPLNEVQPGLHPFEVLYDVHKLLDENNGQPLSAAFQKVIQAIGLYDHWVDVQSAISEDAEQWAQHAVQGILWAEAGCDRLAAIEETIVLAFTDAGGADNNRITTTLNRAYKMARQGQYTMAIATLLDPDVWRGLEYKDYVTWAHVIWHVFVLRTTRRGQDRLFRDFLLPLRPKDFNPKEYLFNIRSSPLSKIRDPLHRVLELRKCHQAASAVEQLLNSIWNAEFMFRMPLYRTGILLLADIGLEFGMTKKSQRIIEEILPQLILGGDIEQRATALFILARCIICVQAESEHPDLNIAVTYLRQAETDFEILEIYDSLLDVRYYLSVLFNTLGMEKERNEVAGQYRVTEGKMRELQVMNTEKEMGDVFRFVSEVGAMLARRK